MGKAKKLSKTANKKTISSQDPSLRLPKVRPIYLRPSYIILGIVVLLLVIFFARVAIWEHGYLNRMEGSERHTASSGITPVNEIDEDIDENEPTEQEITEYVVAPGKPRYFSIPSIGIRNARIVEIGVKASGELSTPYNIYDVGWYNKSALPGTNGVVVIDGHSGVNEIGVFGKLPRVQQDDLIQVEMGDGRLYNYRVVETITKKIGADANNYMAVALSPVIEGQGSLTLITCTGDYWLAQKTFSHRLFVRAILEEPTENDN